MNGRSPLLRIFVLINSLLLSTLLSQNLSAAVYQCKDSKGRKSFQQTPCTEVQLNNSLKDAEHYQLLKKMRGLVSRGKNINNKIGPSLDEIKQCQADVRAFSADIASIEQLVASYQYKYKDIRKAHQELQQCARCKTAAVNNCQSADNFLDEALAQMSR